MRLKVRAEHLLVFAVRGKRKLGSFYMPTKGSVADYHDLQPVWIAEIGGESRLGDEIKVGDLGYILDVYELEDLPIGLWPHYRARLPAEVVAAVEKEALDGDGFICGNIIHEDSLIGIEEDDTWKKESLAWASRRSAGKTDSPRAT